MQVFSIASSSITSTQKIAFAPLHPRGHSLGYHSTRCVRTTLTTRESSASGAAAIPPEDSGPVTASDPVASTNPAPEAAQPSGLLGWWQGQREKSAALRKKLVALGPAAVLAYGLFDGVSYTIAFSIAFLGYEARTGLNPTANVADIVKICILMWAGNNVTRPFRLAGAAALAPFMDSLMVRMQERLKLPNKLVAFLMLTASVAAVCLSIVGSLFLSRWVQG